MDAYALEKNEAGDWVAIGYSAPGDKQADGNHYNSTNFFYVGSGHKATVAANAEAGTEAQAETQAYWTASARVKLNDCGLSASAPEAGSGQWNMKAVVTAAAEAGGENSVAYTVENVTESCGGLTPSFATLARQ